MHDILIYSSELAQQEYTPSHPFKPMRAQLMYELLNRYGLMDGEDQTVAEPQLMDEEMLYLFHTREYIELLKKGEKGDCSAAMLYAGLGTDDNPLFSRMYQYALSAASGTFQGAALLQQGDARFVFNPFGGFHHAGSGHAEGFCYVNDIAVAVAWLVNDGQRVAYIDIDAHHGNGVQDAFYETDRVLNISFHESGKTLYPGSGFEGETGEGVGAGYNVNVPLLAGADDEVYLLAFEALVPPLVRSFRPDVVVACIGCDAHWEDPLSNLNMTSNGYKKMVSIINTLSPRILAVGSGGYKVHKTAALWALAWAEFSEQQPCDLHLGQVGGMMYGPEAGAGQLDDPPYVLRGPGKDRCMADVRRVVDFVKGNIFPLHGIKD
jgi:acetoin utilization protein AcuC